MKRIFTVALGILTAIGGFLDIGDLFTNAVVGSRFGLALVWVVVVGVIGICLYANMAGRVGDRDQNPARAPRWRSAVVGLCSDAVRPRIAVHHIGSIR